MSKIGIVTAKGLGDGLIMHIAAHNLSKKFQVTTFNQHLPGFKKWLQGYTLLKEGSLDPFDAIILQHDNSIRAKEIRCLKKPVFTLFGSYNFSKHGQLSENDFVCNQKKSMGENVRDAIEKWFGTCTLENGMQPPPDLLPRRYPKRIAIHPKSSNENKNWPMEKYEKIVTFLRKKGADPVFLETDTPLFPCLDQLASFLYESGGFIGNDSGPGHLASCVGLKTLIIGNSSSHLRFWKPAWTPPKIITPHPLVTHFHLGRNLWKSFIPTIIVKKTLLNIL